MADVPFDNLEIRQFRAFDFLRIERLGHLNLILGKNNVGKSTLLEALWLRANLGSPDVIRAILVGRDEPGTKLGGRHRVRDPAPAWSTGATGWTPEADFHGTSGGPAWPTGATGPTGWTHGAPAEPEVNCLFHGWPKLWSISSPIQIGCIDAPDKSLTLWLDWRTTTGKESEKDEDGRVGDDESIPALVVEYGAMRRLLQLDEGFDTLSRRWTLQEDPSDELATPCVLMGPGGLDGELLNSLWERVALTDSEEDVIDAMRIIEPGTVDIAVVSSGSRASVRIRTKDSPNPVSLKTMGDGMNRVFGIGLALAGAKNGILLVDEIENGIHWSVMPEVWKFVVKVARRLNVQVFATTHSNDCLKSFHTGTRGNDGVAIRIEKRDGKFNAEVFDENRRSVIVKEEIEIR